MNIFHFSNYDSVQPHLQYVFVINEIDAKLASFMKGANIITLYNAESASFYYNTFINNLPALFEVYNSLIDEDSKKTFCGYWLMRVSNSLAYGHFADTPQYICAGFIPQPGDILIDGGTCDGYTAARFAGMGCKVIGFEMDKKNYELASKVATENNFIVENLGLGSYKHKMNYSHVEGNIGASHLNQFGSEVTTITTLDLYAAEHKLPSIDFIKMDVEGAELDILRGAASSIAKWKPKLAISAYHKPDDFWTLMNFVKSVRSDYEFAMRQYGHSRVDVPFVFNENVENAFATLGFNVTLPNVGECVLLCR